MTAWRLGVDSGGTFTDICLADADTGTICVWKVPSTPDDPSRAIADGVVEGLARTGTAAPGDVTSFGHGTTVATNALIQHRGAVTGLITTAGFRDLLEIGRQRRPHLYDLQCDKPALLIQRHLRMEVPERLRYDGSVDTPLDETAVHAAARALKAAGVQSVAVTFLYAYLDPRHEARVRAILAQEFPEAFVSCSHEVAPEFREFERLSTTVVNAYLGPVMARYIERLGTRLDALGLRGPRHITQSNGGVMSFPAARRQAVRTVLSGPATGVVGAMHVAALSGFSDIITFDMGGTSTDVSLIEDGRPRLAGELEVHGYPLKTPMLDIHTVGAGGGSIAHLDAGGHLKVGPRSAGSVPGPACYGLGNSEPTVTDANVVLGTLNPDHLLAGRMRIDSRKARAAIAAQAERLSLGVMAAAQGIISVVTANMAKAIRLISVQRGYDPREFVLVAFGGAGPLHAARLARELDIPRVLVPRNPGILCALGLLITDLKTNYARTRLIPLSAGAHVAIAEVFASLEGQSRLWFEDEGIAAGDRGTRRMLDMRYKGQNHELSVPVSGGVQGEDLLAQLRQGFERQHQQMYGYSAPEQPIEAVTFRVEATGTVRQASIEPRPPAREPVDGALLSRRDVWVAERGGLVVCPVYDRDRLGPGHRISGPAIIEQMDTTTVILPDQTASVDPYLNIILQA